MQAHPWAKKAAVITLSVAITLGLLFTCLSLAGTAMQLLTGQHTPGPLARWGVSLTPCILVAVLYARWRGRRQQRKAPQPRGPRAAPMPAATAPQPHTAPTQPLTLADRRKALQNR